MAAPDNILFCLDDIFAWGKGTAGVTLPKQPQTHQLSVKWPPQNGASKSEPTIHAKNNIGKAPVNNSTVKVKKGKGRGTVKVEQDEGHSMVKIKQGKSRSMVKVKLGKSHRMVKI